MRLEQQRIGVLFVALLLGGSISLSLFVFMVFLIEPEKSISHMPGPYMVTFVDIKDKNKAKKKPGKKMEMPKVPAIPGLTPVKPQVPQKVRNRRISVRFPTIGSIDVYSSGSGSALDLNLGTEEHYSSKDNRKVLFNQVKENMHTLKKRKSFFQKGSVLRVAERSTESVIRVLKSRVQERVAAAIRGRARSRKTRMVHCAPSMPVKFHAMR